MQGGARERSPSRWGLSRELEAGDEIVSEYGQDLPGAVGGEATAGHGVEGVAAFELSQNFLLGPTSTHEVPQRTETERLVGGDPGVLPMPVVGIEQIELEVLAGLVLDFPTIDRDAQRAFPGRHFDPSLERLKLSRDPRPTPLALNQRLQSQPRIERDLDRVLGARREPGHDFGPEKRAIESHLDPHAPAQAAPHLSEQVAQERRPRL